MSEDKGIVIANILFREKIPNSLGEIPGTILKFF